MDGKTLADIGREMEQYRDAGMAGCKFKVGGLSPREDAAARRGGAPGRRRRLRAAGRRQPRLERAGRDRIRASASSTSTSAGSRSRATGTTTPRMMARVRQSTAHSRSPPANARSRSHGGAPPGRRRRGRLRELRRLRRRRCHRLAARRGALRGAGVEMAHHEEAQIAQHLLSAVPHGTYAECFADPDRDPIWQSMWANRPQHRKTAGSTSRPAPASTSRSTRHGEALPRELTRVAAPPTPGRTRPRAGSCPGSPAREVCAGMGLFFE